MADMVCVSGGACDANWQPFPTLSQHAQGPGPDGFAYWDGFSWDGPDANIGYFISGTGFFAGDPASPDADLPYFGNADGSAVASFYFDSGGLPQVATLIDATSQWAPDNSIGWYDPNSGQWGWIFQANGATPTIPQSVVFDPTEEFGLFFLPDSLTYNPSESYYTNDALNGIAAADVTYAAANGIMLGPEDYQHFAVFESGNNGYYVGVKDRSAQVGDNDFNDMIIQLAAVPEPRSFALGAMALLLPFGVYITRTRR